MRQSECLIYPGSELPRIILYVVAGKLRKYDFDVMMIYLLFVLYTFKLWVCYLCCRPIHGLINTDQENQDFSIEFIR